MIGDFNASNYTKGQEEDDFKVNRSNYISLSKGYFDAVQGKYTRGFKNQKTQIDRILISQEFLKTFKVENKKVDYDIRLSDHYPIMCEIHINSDKSC